MKLMNKVRTGTRTSYRAERLQQAGQLQEIITTQRRDVISKIYKRYTGITFVRPVRLLEFENTLDLERFLLSLPGSSPLVIEGYTVKTIRSEDVHVGNATSELNRAFSN